MRSAGGLGAAGMRFTQRMNRVVLEFRQLYCAPT